MANIGEIAEIINASEAHLVVGADTYILLQDLDVHIGRPEFRDASTGGGAVYTYGKGEHHMTFTLIASPPELISLTLLNNLDANGALPTPTAWTIVATDVSGGTATMVCTGNLNPLDIRKGPEGKVFVDCFVRITGDTVAIT